MAEWYVLYHNIDMYLLFYLLYGTTILAISNYFHSTMAKVKKAHSSSEMKLNVEDAMLDKVITVSQRT